MAETFVGNTANEKVIDNVLLAILAATIEENKVTDTLPATQTDVELMLIVEVVEPFVFDEHYVGIVIMNV